MSQGTDRPIDLRSDTVTHPTAEMRAAMASAELGDDVFGDDPTVIALEERAAELLGKEAALFTASGTMGNLVSLLAHVPRGGEIITDADSHIVWHEAGGHAVIAGASARVIEARSDGTMDPLRIREAFRDPEDPHNPITSLITLENAHANSMGQPLPASYVREVAAIARELHVPLHVDGARLFNAAVALGVPARDLVADADSAMFSLSKGLSCPIGSMVVGTRDFIWRARRARKIVGGGMRQVGVLAAPGLIALRDGPRGMIERLAEDHENARALATALAEMAGIADLDPARVRTNFVIFRVQASDAHGRRGDLREAFLGALADRGVLMVPYPDRRIRAVTHYGVERADIDHVVDAARDALVAVGAAPARTQPGAERAVAAAAR
jgi:threonine aldolase